MNLIHPSSYINPTSIVDEGAAIGANTMIWHWVHISKGAQIGCNCNLGQNVFISGKVKIGNNVKIQNNVSVYDGVIIEDNVFCGPSMVFTNVINPRSLFPRKSEYKKTIIKSGASFGANCTILCGVTIGNSSFVGAGALVNRDVKDFALVTGIPAKQIGWMSEYGDKIPLPLSGEGYWYCKKTNSTYILKENYLIKK